MCDDPGCCVLVRNSCDLNMTNHLWRAWRSDENSGRKFGFRSQSSYANAPTVPFLVFKFKCLIAGLRQPDRRQHQEANLQPQRLNFIDRQSMPMSMMHRLLELMGGDLHRLLFWYLMCGVYAARSTWPLWQVEHWPFVLKGDRWPSICRTNASRRGKSRS